MHFKTGKFTQTDRLRGKSNFALFFRAKQYKGKFLRIAVIPASEDKITGKIYRKVAFAVGKKTASKAVDRNKIKRRLREIYRIHRNLLPDNIWLMIIANSGSKDESYRSMENELKSILRLLQPKTLAIGLVKFYKYFISPYTGSRCRYYPSCSSYALEAFETKGFIRGLILSVYRIIRCNPISSGGYDPVNKEDKFIFRDV